MARSQICRQTVASKLSHLFQGDFLNSEGGPRNLLHRQNSVAPLPTRYAERARGFTDSRNAPRAREYSLAGIAENLYSTLLVL